MKNDTVKQTKAANAAASAVKTSTKKNVTKAMVNGVNKKIAQLKDTDIKALSLSRQIGAAFNEMKELNLPNKEDGTPYKGWEEFADSNIDMSKTQRTKIMRLSREYHRIEKLDLPEDDQPTSINAALDIIANEKKVERIEKGGSDLTDKQKEKAKKQFCASVKTRCDNFADWLSDRPMSEFADLDEDAIAAIKDVCALANTLISQIEKK